MIVLLLVQEGDRVKFDAAWDEQRAKMKDGGIRVWGTHQNGDIADIQHGRCMYIYMGYNIYIYCVYTYLYYIILYMWYKYATGTTHFVIWSVNQPCLCERLESWWFKAKPMAFFVCRWSMSAPPGGGLADGQRWYAICCGRGYLELCVPTRPGTRCQGCLGWGFGWIWG